MSVRTNAHKKHFVIICAPLTLNISGSRQISKIWLVTYEILGPGAARKKFDELSSPIWTFYVTQSFLSRDPFGLPWGPGVKLAVSCLAKLV